MGRINLRMRNYHTDSLSSFPFLVQEKPFLLFMFIYYLCLNMFKGVLQQMRYFAIDMKPTP